MKNLSLHDKIRRAGLGGQVMLGTRVLNLHGTLGIAAIIGELKLAGEDDGDDAKIMRLVRERFPDWEVRFFLPEEALHEYLLEELRKARAHLGPDERFKVTTIEEPIRLAVVAIDDEVLCREVEEFDTVVDEAIAFARTITAGRRVPDEDSPHYRKFGPDAVITYQGGLRAVVWSRFDLDYRDDDCVGSCRFRPDYD
jgi:hypothetical protein